MFDVCIIGGGIIGSAIGHELQLNRNVKTAIFDKGKVGANGATQASGGFLRMFDFNKYHTQLSLMSFDFHKKYFCHTGFEQKGHVFIINKKQLSKSLPSLKLMQKFRYPFELIDRNEARSRFPELVIHNDELLICEPLAGYANPRQTVDILIHEFKNSDGLLFENEYVDSFKYDMSTNVTHIKTSKGEYEARKVIFCMGAWIRKMEAFKYLGITNKLIEIMYINSKMQPSTCFNDNLQGLYSKPGQNNERLIGLPQNVFDIDPEQQVNFNQEFFNSHKAMINERICDYNESTFLRGVSSFDSYTKDKIPQIQKISNGWIIASGFNGAGYKMYPAIAQYINTIL